MNESVNESVSKAINESVKKLPGNNAFAVLYGLTLGLTAPDDEQIDKVADLVAHLLNRSRLTTEDLDALKAAAVVIVRHGQIPG